MGWDNSTYLISEEIAYKIISFQFDILTLLGNPKIGMNCVESIEVV